MVNHEELKRNLRDLLDDLEAQEEPSTVASLTAQAHVCSEAAAYLAKCARMRQHLADRMGEKP